MSLGSWFKSLKKKVTLKGVISGVAKVGAALPVVGGLFQTVANAASAATSQASSAQQQAQQQVEAAAASGTFVAAPGGPQPAIQLNMQTLLLVGAGIVALFFLTRHRG